MSSDAVWALRDRAVQTSGAQRPPSEKAPDRPGIAQVERDFATKLIGATSGLAGERALEVGDGELHAAGADFIGSDRAHVGNLVRSAIERAHRAGKAEEVVQNARIRGALTLKAP